MKKWMGWTIIILLLLGGAAYGLKESMNQRAEPLNNASGFKAPTTQGNEITYEIVAQQTQQEVAPGITLPVYTYNGSVPGQEIRVKMGQDVVVKLINKLQEPVTIHWHGYPVPNKMDGVPGLTQNAVQPGETFVYRFKASVPGTYWYHSHQSSSKQVDKGLYGALIVEESTEEERTTRDYTVLLDEMESGTSKGMGMMNSGYDIFTVNGKSGTLISPYEMKTGEKVRMRFINAGYSTHYLHFGSLAYQVIAVDGQSLQKPVAAQGKLLPVGAGERYDIEFIAPDTSIIGYDQLDHKAAAGMLIPLKNTDTDNVEVPKEYKGIFSLVDNDVETKRVSIASTAYDKTYTMELGHGMSMNGMVFTINGKTYPNIDKLGVKKGDRVKVELINNDPMNDHPMHLHGHEFQVLSKDGKSLEGKPVFKDTLLLKPGEKYEVAFVANNPGNWMFHCHQLQHAAAGMMTTVNYDGYPVSKEIDQAQNKE